MRVGVFMVVLSGEVVLVTMVPDFAVWQTVTSSVRLETGSNSRDDTRALLSRRSRRKRSMTMMKPSVLSVGIGMGVLMLGGSGIAIPTLWSRATRVEHDRDKLSAALQEAHDAGAMGEDALQAAKQQLAELHRQVEADRELLDAAQASKRTLTNQLAEVQTRNRELTATSGTLELRDQEVAALVQQLEQLRSDHDSLLAQRDAAAKRDPAQPAAGTLAADDLVPVLPSDLVPVLPSDLVPVLPSDLVPVPSTVMPPRDPASAMSRIAAKPPASEPLRFDDRGWKSVAPSTADSAVYPFPQIDYGVTNPTTVISSSSAAVIVP